MRQITTFNDVNEVLKRYVPHVPLGHRYSLDRMQALMKYLGNPQDKLRVVHIAGTSGKTSTAYYIAAMLHAGGYKVGLTVSPHVDGINERVQINGRPLEEAAFTKEFTRFLKLIEQFDDEPTYFEVLIAFVYWLFYKRSVDYEVIEVGLGGLLDGTNVAKRPDKICVITDIGLDHMDVLGQTVDKIAAQKAGIIHPHNKVFSYVQSDKVMAVIRNVAAKNQAELHEITPSARSTPSDLPLFQRRNWYLANKVSEYILGTNGQSLSPAALATTVQTLVPARMEAIEVGDKTVIIDGSHNEQKIMTLLESLKHKYPGQPISTVISFGHNKNVGLEASLKLLTAASNHVIITTFNLGQDEVRSPINPRKILELCHRLGYQEAEIITDPVEAFQDLLKRPEHLLLVTGSFYLLNHIRPLILKK